MPTPSFLMPLPCKLTFEAPTTVIPTKYAAASCTDHRWTLTSQSSLHTCGTHPRSFPHPEGPTFLNTESPLFCSRPGSPALPLGKSSFPSSWGSSLCLKSFPHHAASRYLPMIPLSRNAERRSLPPPFRRLAGTPRGQRSPAANFPRGRAPIKASARCARRSGRTAICGRRAPSLRVPT